MGATGARFGPIHVLALALGERTIERARARSKGGPTERPRALAGERDGGQNHFVVFAVVTGVLVIIGHTAATLAAPFVGLT
jgi:hypothetical protein